METENGPNDVAEDFSGRRRPCRVAGESSVLPERVSSYSKTVRERIVGGYYKVLRILVTVTGMETYILHCSGVGYIEGLG